MFRFTSLRYVLLALAVMGLFGVPDVSAQFSGAGAGTKDDPYKIYNPAQLNQVRNYTGKTDVYFTLGADIDLTSWISSNSPEQGWNPIGTDANPFKGTFSGNGHTIKGMSISRGTTSNVGFFGVASDATISNLTIEGSANGGNNVGILAGNFTGTIENCRAKGTVNGSSDCVGGLVGKSGNSDIKTCRADVTVKGADYVGGLIGYVLAGGTSSDKTIDNCFASGTVDGRSNVGGLIGAMDVRAFAKLRTDVGSYNYYYWYVTAPYKYMISNCGVKSSIFASSSVGGLIGQTLGLIYTYELAIIYWASDYTEPKNYTFSNEKAVKCVNVNGCFALAQINTQDSDCGGIIGTINGTDVSNSYFNGSIVGGKNTGGICGSITTPGTVTITDRDGKEHKRTVNPTDASAISRNYSRATIAGSEYVGGIIGNITSNATVTSNFALNPVLSASVGPVARISPTTTDGFGAIGSLTTNYTLTGAKVSKNGVSQTYSTKLSEGESGGEDMFKLRATYQGLGWDFDKEWAIQETECLPYKSGQCVPPLIQSEPVSGSFIIVGKSMSGGRVFMEYAGQTYSAECKDNTWTVRTDPMKSGESITAWVEADDKLPSYSVMTSVGYPGSGTQEDPYQIYTANDLQNINGHSWYKLMNDIDLNGVKWQPIGRNGATMANLDGGGFTIKNLNVKDSASDFCGLFSTLQDATITNLTLEGCSVDGGSKTAVLAGDMTSCTISNVTIIKANVKGDANVGALAGNAYYCTLQNVQVLESTIGGSSLVGGIIGTADRLDITLSSFNGDVTGSDKVGGICATANSVTKISRSCTSGTVTGTGTDTKAAGIVAESRAYVTDCFTTANISAPGYVGGIVGLNYASVSNCYASGTLSSETLAAGIVAYNDGASATLKNSAAASEKISVSSQSGNAMRVLGGFRNGAPEPVTAENLALEKMIVSINGVAQEVYDDPMNGTATSGDKLRQSATYKTLGWDFATTWQIGETEMPQLIGLDTTGGAERRDNYMYVDKMSAAAGETFDIIVNLHNGDAVNGFQFDIQLPTGVSLVYDEDFEEYDYTKGTRLTRNHSISFRKQPDGSVRFLCLPKDATYNLLGDDGQILILKAKADDNAINGSYAFLLKNCFLSRGVAENVVLNKVSGNIYIVNDVISIPAVTAMAGSKSDLVVNLDNKSKINSFQFDMALPAGVKIADNALGEPDIRLGDRIDKSKYTLTYKAQPDGSMRIVAFGAGSDAVITGNTGTVLYVTLAVDKLAKPFNGQVSFRNIYLADSELRSFTCEDIDTQIEVTQFRRKGDVNKDGTITGVDAVGTINLSLNKSLDILDFWAADVIEDNIIDSRDVLSVTSLVLDENLTTYAAAKFAKIRKADDVWGDYEYTKDICMWVKPVNVSPGNTADFIFYLNNTKEHRPSATQWAIELPEGFTFELNENPVDADDLWYENTRRCSEFLFVAHVQGQKIGMFHNDMNVKGYKLTTGEIMRLHIVADKSVKPGVYTGWLRDYQTTCPVDAQGFHASFYIDDEPFTIVVGDIANVENLSLAGRFDSDDMALVDAALHNNSSLLTVDLTENRAIPEGTSIEGLNPNTIVYANAATTIEKSDNLVVDGICKSLKLEDGHPFGVTTAFTATSALYSRQVEAGAHESLYLPFAADPIEGVTYKQIAGVSTDNFVLEDAVQSANTPVLFNSEFGGALRFTATNVTIEPATETVHNELVGNYRIVDTDKVYYGYSAGSFVKTLRLMPFRAYTTNAELDGKHETVNDLLYNTDSDNDVIYNLQGIRMHTDKKNLTTGLYIINGQKVYIK